MLFVLPILDGGNRTEEFKTHWHETCTTKLQELDALHHEEVHGLFSNDRKLLLSILELNRITRPEGRCFGYSPKTK